MILLAALGMFVFTTNSVPFQSFERSQSWRHPHQNVVGDAPPSQYTGKDPEEIVINAELRPEVTGGNQSINDLRKMADTGLPHPLILGNGRMLGSFVILSIKEGNSQLNEDGTPRAINFTMTLKKVSDTAVGLAGQNLLLAVGMVRSLTGV